MVGEGDNEGWGVDLVEEAFAGAALDLFEAGQCFEEKGDVCGRCAHVVEGIALCGGAGVAQDVEKAVEEVDLIGKDVDGEVGHVGREGHPGAGQWVQSAGDIED